MDPQTVRESFQKEIDSIRSSSLCKAFKWEFEINIEEYLAYLIMMPRKAEDRRYLLRIKFDDYPQRAPSYIFVDNNTKEERVDVWPPGIRHSGPPPGICTPGTREFHEHLHKNDARHQWDADKYKISNTLMQIQLLIDKPK